MKALSSQPGFVATLLAMLLVAGCMAERVASTVPLQVSFAGSFIPEDQLLDIGVNILAPVPEAVTSEEATLQSLRAAESHYISWQLAEVLRSSGNWGTIRLNPFMLNNADLMISGAILQSDGETLRVRIRAIDSTGRSWLDREYYQVVDAAVYAVAPGDTPPFPFQSLLNQAANDMLAFRNERLAARDLDTVRKVSSLRFATEFAPEIYGPYLASNDAGLFILDRLPAGNDPIFAEISGIRERNELFLDAIQSQYSVFVKQVDESYRKFLARSRLITAILNQGFNAAESQAQYGASLVELGGMSKTVENTRIRPSKRRSDTLNVGNNAYVYAAALAKAGSSLEMDVQPQTLQFSEHTVNLSGSLEEQFEQWREILGEIHELNVAL